MAPIPKRLNMVSRIGPDPTIRISDEQFARLERIYGQVLDAEARSSISGMAHSFLRWRITELTSENFSEVRRLFDRFKKALGPFQKFAFGEMVGMSDAGAQLEGILVDAYHRFPIHINPRHLSAIADDGSKEPIEVTTPVCLELNSDTLMQVAISLGCAIGQAEADIARQEADDRKGFAPGGAFRDWLFEMRNWARARYFPYGGFGDDRETPAPFAEFLYELNEMFAQAETSDADGQPKGAVLKEPVKSAKAMAERLKQVAATANRLDREGG